MGTRTLRPEVRATLDRVRASPDLATVRAAILTLGELGVDVLEKVAPDIVRAQVHLAHLERTLEALGQSA